MASNIKSSRDEASYIIATSKHGVPRRFHIDVSRLTRRSLDDQATRNRRRQMQAASTHTHSRRRRISLPHASLLDKPD